MKKLILILSVIFIGLTGISQSPITADSLYFSTNDTIILKWYHDDFGDSDYPFLMCNEFYMIKEYHTADSISVQPKKDYKRYLGEGDSIKNPNGNNYYTYEFVKNYIYSNGEDMKRTLTLFHIRNWDERILE